MGYTHGGDSARHLFILSPLLAEVAMSTPGSTKGEGAGCCQELAVCVHLKSRILLVAAPTRAHLSPSFPALGLKRPGVHIS